MGKRKRSKWAKRCTDCGKVIASWNKSGFCSRHWKTNWDKENKEQRSENSKKRYQKNKEKILKRRREYYQENRERIIKYNEEYRLKHKKKVKDA